MKTSKSILLVEDDKDDQYFFIEALSKIENATIYDVASNGKEALDKLKNSVILPDLIFMDINMPLMNGIECLSEIIKTSKIRDIPVVILSTDTGKAEIVRELGAKAFIKKPCDIKILHEKLKQMINSDFIVDSLIGNQIFKPFFQQFNQGGNLFLKNV